MSRDAVRPEPTTVEVPALSRTRRHGSDSGAGEVGQAISHEATAAFSRVAHEAVAASLEVLEHEIGVATPAGAAEVNRLHSIDHRNLPSSVELHAATEIGLLGVEPIAGIEPAQLLEPPGVGP